MAYDISLLSYDNISGSVTAQDSSPQGITFNNDGSKIYMVGTSTDRIHQYSLPTPYDISTLSYDNISGSVAEDGTPTGIAFNNDGTKIYMVGWNRRIHQYSLPTPYNLSGMTYDNISGSVAAQDSFPQGITFNNDGSKIYMVGTGNERIYQYTLSTPYDISTLSYDNIYKIIGTEDLSSNDIAFNNDGTKIYMVGYGNDGIYQYTLSTPYNLSGMTYDNISGSVAAQDGTPTGIAFNNDGSKIYMVGTGTDRIHQYSCGDAATTGTNQFINIGDSLRQVSEMYINIGDSWRAVSELFVNIGDSWRQS